MDLNNVQPALQSSQQPSSFKYESAFEREFMGLMPDKSEGEPKTIADLIAQKIREKRNQLAGHFNQEEPVQSLDPAVVDLYKQIGIVLSKYTSGKLPKGFKTMPALANWEQLLQITRPDKWTSAAMYEATRLFIANLKEKPAQRFLASVVLPRVRDDIAERKKLNVHIYKALVKALYKPGAFFKGIVLPLCESSDCTQREASIVCSVIVRNHIPILHACAAMLRIAEMKYSTTNTIFLNALIQKRYALPYRVIDAVVFHFIRLSSEYAKDPLPGLWHRCFYHFVEFYLKDISPEQKEALDFSLTVQWHSGISPKIRKMLRTGEFAPLNDMEGGAMNVDSQDFYDQKFDSPRGLDDDDDDDDDKNDQDDDQMQ